MNDTTPVTVVIPVVDCLLCYNRGGFWAGAYAFKYFVTLFDHITRLAFDHFMHTKMMYHALHETGLAEKYNVQDIGHRVRMLGSSSIPLTSLSGLSSLAWSHAPR